MVLLAALAAAVLAVGAWQTRASLPEPRSEVAGALVGAHIAVVGGFRSDRSSSPRVDLYSPRTDTWTRLPDLPVAVNHPLATSLGGRLYVLGGYGDAGASARAFALRGGSWRELPRMPAVRAAGGAAAIGRTIYVVGGVGPNGLARRMLAYDVVRGRWRTLPGPFPREHLGVAVLRGWVYAVGGRFPITARVERWRPDGGWRRVAPLPEPRGGTAAAAAGGLVVSAGAESAAGTSSAVYGYDPRRRAWRRLPDLPTARHGLALVGSGSTVFAIGGGPQPGFSSTGANESLTVASPRSRGRR